MNRHTQRKTALLAVCLLIVLGLAASELLVRLLMPYNTPDTLRRHSVAYERAPFTRSRLAPMDRLVDADAAKGWGTKPDDAPSERTFHINNLGFRGRLSLPESPRGRPESSSWAGPRSSIRTSRTPKQPSGRAGPTARRRC